MSLKVAQILQDDLIAPLIWKTAYGLATTCILGAAAYVGYRVGTPEKHQARQYQNPELNDQIKKVVDSLKITDDQLIDIMQILEEEMNAGLSLSTHKQATVKMFPSYVRNIPNGTEIGQVLALDLGGTNFRILLIDLHGDSTVEITSRIFVIPQSIMIGDGKHLFHHLAECLHEFMEKEHLLNTEICYPLGFTFSFPCQQEGLASARLTTWTKGFNCSGVVNEDVVKLLQDAINEKHINTKCVALVNDTVGTLMACAYKDPSTAIGLILGTGTNACYIESLDKVGTWNGTYDEPKQVIINTEWGAFGDNGRLNFIRTKYDEEVDISSINPGKQIFEKMISGMYMGEIVRLVLLDLMQQELLFLGHRDAYRDYTTPLYNSEGFHTKYVSTVETDEGIQFSNTRRVLENIGIQNPTYDDCAIVQYICRQVSKRAARLAAAGLAVLINRMGKPHVTVGVDGSLYRYHPHFKHNIESCMETLVNNDFQFTLTLSDDGSGKGAAMVACVADASSYKETRVHDEETIS
ncbi:unnamed protein product [Rotaria sp. Silwood2]|nr:unnamed protein product [Rotaria sp. Silwood2]CAF3155438.1 unnamed protein product [Rotaria sp. Silwood2]CAF4237878.1 unnamed protein product [Rotaria sp. Silwood2]CAF4341728.1 unnamed protein product [Rotaria sp. Silwood2]